MTTQIKLSAPVYFAVGEDLNGQTLAVAQWVRGGEAEVSIERAEALERDGYADILSKGGVPYRWSACCSGGDHDHT